MSHRDHGRGSTVVLALLAALGHNLTGACSSEKFTHAPGYHIVFVRKQMTSFMRLSLSCSLQPIACNAGHGFDIEILELENPCVVNLVQQDVHRT